MLVAQGQSGPGMTREPSGLVRFYPSRISSVKSTDQQA